MVKKEKNNEEEKLNQFKENLSKIKDTITKTFDNVFCENFDLDFKNIKEKHNLNLKNMRSPVLDFFDKNKTNYQIEIELPGIQEKNIEIELKSGVLFIIAKRDEKIKTIDEEKGIYKVERKHCGFFRTISLPLDFDEKKIKAKFENGLLEISIGRLKEDSIKKTIKIN